jgi:hypothetical protein
MSGNGINATVEVIVGDDAEFCLDLENNTNDDVYSFLETDDVGSIFRIEQLTTLTDPQPGGAGNTGTVSITMGAGAEDPTEVADGFCGF